MARTFEQAWDDRIGRMAEVWFIDLTPVGLEAVGGKCGPNMRQIIQWEPEAVWVHGSHLDDSALRASQMDDEGNCLLLVPAAQVTNVYSEQEAASAEMCWEADMDLLAQAHG